MLLVAMASNLIAMASTYSSFLFLVKLQDRHILQMIEAHEALLGITKAAYSMGTVATSLHPSVSTNPFWAG